MLNKITWLPKTILCGLGIHSHGVNELGIKYDQNHCLHCTKEDVSVLLSVDNSEYNYELMNSQRKDPSSNLACLVSGMVIAPLFKFSLVVFVVANIVGYLI